MNRDLLLRRALRATAVVIAVAAVIDPAVTSARSSKPAVAVVAVDGVHDSALADRVARTLANDFTVIPASFSAGAATVLVGDRLPATTSELASPAFAVVGMADGATVRLESAHAPASAPFDSRVPVSVVARATGAGGRTLDVTLRAGGLVVDRVSRTVNGDDQRVPVSLTYLPTAPGAAPLRVTAQLSGSQSLATADVVVDARDTRWSVLFFDPRPSWMSTFVRRAVERDRRFVVTSRVVTSRNISIDAGQPPNRLDDLAGVARFDAIVVGAPDALSASDVAGLESFLRRRGGSVVLLLDQAVAGPYDRLTDVRTWSTRSTGPIASIARTGADSAGVRASEIAWPATLPSGADPLAHTMRTTADSATDRTVVWRAPVGAGQLTVSGALDAWRYRDRSDFDRFWQTAIAEAADAALPAVAITTSNAIVAPGERAEVTVTFRDVALRGALPARASASASIASSTDSMRTNVALLPDGPVGHFRGSFRGPKRPGTYRVAAVGDGITAETPIVVSSDVAHAAPEGHDMLGAWIGAHGGRVLTASRLAELPAALRSAIRPQPSAETWHPMRSTWWIVPFALTLGGEWWLRRRKGLA
ncbi:MAG: hypothetical protein JWM41_4341 [Gemmatimonadetes bacterium]|nr:hypothetical protein [Gemmatimonadota bacterium]